MYNNKHLFEGKVIRILHLARALSALTTLPSLGSLGHWMWHGDFEHVCSPIWREVYVIVGDNLLQRFCADFVALPRIGK